MYYVKIVLVVILFLLEGMFAPFPHTGGAYSPCLWGKIPIGMGKVGKCIFSTPFFRNRAIYSRLDSQELIPPKLV